MTQRAQGRGVEHPEDEVFLSPRVVDQRAFEEFSGALKTLVRDAAQQKAALESSSVEVNGELVAKLPAFVDPENDRVVVDGRPVRPPGRKVYIALHKPTHTLVTATDEPGLDRRTVLDLVDHPFKARLFPVGRLHFDATGLVLLTYDGEFANRLTHPRYGVTKTYWAMVRGTLDEARLAEVDRSLRKLDRAANRAATGLKAGPRRAAPRPEGERPHRPKGTRPQVRVVKSAEGKPAQVQVDHKVIEAYLGAEAEPIASAVPKVQHA